MPLTNQDLNNFTTTTAAANHHLTAIFNSPEEIENDISASIDFTSSLDQFDFSILDTPTNHQIPSTENYHSLIHPLNICPPLPSLYEDKKCLPPLPNAYSSVFDPSMDLNSFLPNNFTTTTLSTENSGNLFFGSDFQLPEFNFQGDNGGIFCQEPLPKVYNSCEIQGLNNESHHGVGSSTATLGSDITSIDDSTFKVGKLTAEERREKIQRYMKKRNERNFSKKIKYACRKTLADSRPRVRGRFAKNDEFRDTTRTTYGAHEDGIEEEARTIQVVVKEEEQMVDSSDIFAHISGVNSFKCSYPIQSWI